MVFNHNRTTISDGVFLGSVVMDRLWDAEKQEGTLYKVGPGGIGVEPRVSLQMFFAFGQVELIPYQPIIAVLNEIASMCEQAVWAIQNSLLDDAQVVMSSIKG